MELQLPARVQEELIETCWRIVGKSDYVFECGIYGSDRHLEVRVTYSVHEELIHAEPVQSLAAGRDVARRWRQMLLDQGYFSDVQ